MDRARTTAHADELPNRRAVASGYADGPGEMAVGAAGREGTLGPRLEAFRHYRARGEQGMFAGSGGWQLRPRPTAPASEQDGAPGIGRLIMSYIPPWLTEPPHYSLKHHGPRLGQILAIAVVVALIGFLVAVFIANVTAGGG